MKKNEYYYQFLRAISVELASLARELEYSVFTSPRMMLTNSRTFVEDIVHRVLNTEGISDIGCSTLMDRIQLLQSQGIVPQDIQDAIHIVRKAGNDASHNTRVFRYSEALKSWEALYLLVRWYMEVYGPLSFEMPRYQEPQIEHANNYDIEEVELRLSQWQNAVLSKVTEIAGQMDSASTVKEEVTYDQSVDVPGDTKVRTITYQDNVVDVPYFLRDSFLLPQRFLKSERFMIALGGVEQARIMSELPPDLEGLSSRVKRYNETHEALLFEDLASFIEEEKERRSIMKNRPGELFIFFQSNYLIVTDKLAKTPLTNDYFKGFPNFLRQLQEDGKHSVSQLPQELVILAKYDRVGINTVEKLFEQMVSLQKQDS
ncbi:type I restriction enzyme EcoKI subunit R [Paraliobacillus sp. PM-2]|uniref:DUF4145 domain-containing protein n=1 Tax=Paraliobacillus sp. PM-2 TaxID=1462524 RepID=UPI00061C37CE|nr:DUF4145 domain-containing protein [Paraliobacillus sp. PM-2]CQR46612.1 type I restriction enzyme EcoKI subunit R [Paraliobacillus sp. PM-2]